MNNLHVKTGDNVMIISGKDKGHTGKVLQVSPSENKVIVEGQNTVKSSSPPSGRAGRYRQGRGCYVRIQGHAHLPQIAARPCVWATSRRTW